jgi:hypothetical protein
MTCHKHPNPTNNTEWNLNDTEVFSLDKTCHVGYLPISNKCYIYAKNSPKPRAATSVATKIGALPDRNSKKESKLQLLTAV